MNMHEPGLLKRMSLSLVEKTTGSRLRRSNNTLTPEIGARFEQTTPSAPVWIVQTVMNVKTSQFPLVHLTSERHPDMLKVVSLSTLYDHEEFVPAKH